MQRLSRASRKQFAALRLKKNRRASGLFLAEGLRVCEALASSGAQAAAVLASPRAAGTERGARVLEALVRGGAEAFSCTDGDIAAVADAATAQGLVAVCKRREASLGDLTGGDAPLLVALDGVADPGNVGAILRAADWFGAGGLLLGEGCAEATSPKTVRASAGSLFHVPCLEGVDLAETLAQLRGQGFEAVLADATGSPEWLNWRRGKAVLVLGSEAHGPSAAVRSAASRAVAVPSRGRAESLNVALAAAVLLAGAEGRPL